jgi:hypothetical protein
VTTLKISHFCQRDFAGLKCDQFHILFAWRCIQSQNLLKKLINQSVAAYLFFSGCVYAGIE